MLQSERLELAVNVDFREKIRRTRSATCDTDLFHSAIKIGVKGAIERFVTTLIITNIPWLMIVPNFQDLLQFL